MPLIAEIAVSGTTYSFDMLFSYNVPANMQIYEGCRVLIPFGKGNQRRIGAVIHLKEGNTSSLKSITAQIDSSPVLSPELLELAEYLHEHTFCTYFEAVKTILPPAISINAKERFQLVKSFENSEILSTDAYELFKNLEFMNSDSMLTEFIENYISKNGRRYIDELIEADAVKSINEFRQTVGDASVKMVRLSEAYLNDPCQFSLTPKQKKAADFLKEYGSASVRETAYMCGFTEAVVKRLVVNRVAVEYDMEIFRAVDDFSGEQVNIDDTVLSDEQQTVHDRVFSQITEQKPAVFLLHGVTGSGKTSVFEKLIKNTIGLGRSAMLLIPEIALTPQVLKRFRLLFGQRVAVIHSGLSLGQRLDEYKRIKKGNADIVIGTRSAIFAPLENIGLIIIDEEGERTYKSENSPRYFTHDIAKQRCAYNKSVLLLASATPSVESYYLAEKGIYNLLEINNRYGQSILPDVVIVDMNEELMAGNRTQFSHKLINEININLQNGEQSMLLLNRRGFHTIISCCECGQSVNCPNCSVPMTFHKKNNKLMCHYCGYSGEMPKKCSSCGSERFRSMGFGTQKLEEQLNGLFPDAKILRMDADTVFSRYTYEENFTAFKHGEYDIMIGTQMIGKGLDFPNVTLVGVLSVDKALYAGDFRSYERTFSLITQVVGRGGRGETKGRAVLQTFIPDHYIMNLAASQDYKEFYKEEIAIRRVMIFPPFCDMCVFCLVGEDEEAVKNGADEIIKLMNQNLRQLQPKTPVRVLGPVKSLYGKINGRYRYRIIMKYKNNAEMRSFISCILKEGTKLKNMKKVTLYADINGDTGI
ncbi:MAG: primosomal protein N' [Ruminococcus sp.]|nr:primosomal protein N' [Ruminococcus sp.]